MKSISPWLKYYSRYIPREIIKRKRKDPISIAFHQVLLGKFLREESLYPTSARFYYQLANLKRGRLILVGKGSRARSPLSVNVNHSHGKHHALASAFNPAAYLLCAWESSHASTIVRSIRSWCFEKWDFFHILQRKMEFTKSRIQRARRYRA